MPHGYIFENQIIALRALIYREDYFEHPYKPSTFADIKSLVILMETLLKEQGVPWDERRGTRLNILGYILGYTVDTTYDLTPYQATTIYRFFSDTASAQRFGIPRDQFFKDCKEHAERSALYREGLPNKHPVRKHRTSASVSDLRQAST